MRAAPARRPGLSLTEVLVAIFVMGLGMISLLTLFPLGAVSMGQALRDDRISEVGLTCDGFLRSYWKAFRPTADGVTNEPAFAALDDPYLLDRRLNAPPLAAPFDQLFVSTYLGGVTAATPSGGPPSNHTEATDGGTKSSRTTTTGFTSEWVIPTGLTGGPTTPATAANLGNTNSTYSAQTPALRAFYGDYEPGTFQTSLLKSCPVLIDGVGFASRVGLGQDAVNWVGDSPTTNFPRRTLQSVANDSTAVQRWFVLSDDITFEKRGAPAANDLTSSSVVRNGRYTCSAILQRDPIKFGTAVGVQLLLYDGRPSTVASTGTEVVATGTVQSVRQLQVTLPNPTDPMAPPLVKVGGWVMDGTIEGPADNQRRNANFYRITGLQSAPGATTTQYTIDIDRDYKMDTTVALVPGTTTARLFFFANLAEVFTRPPLED